jgi:hypothetical protein
MDRSYTTYAGVDIIDQGKRDVTWAEVREMRDYWLEKTDWRAMKDRTISQAWKDYRTALRNLPQENDTANDAADNWPVMPDE